MTQELGFRVWDTELGEYTRGTNVVLTIGGALMEYDRYEKNGLYGAVEGRYIAQRAAGLKDKNQLPIYEGDIIKAELPEREGEQMGYSPAAYDGLTYTTTTVMAAKTLICEVRITPAAGARLLIRKVIEHEPAHQVAEKEDAYGTFREGIKPGARIRIKSADEIIGNIYENPELIK